jgi:hypothetical protein
MSDHGESERLEAFRDGWPEWLSGTWVSANGPTVEVRPGTPQEMRRRVEELASQHRVRVEEGDSYLLPEDGNRPSLLP